MKTSRRTFIRTGAMAVAATALMGRSALAQQKRKGIVGLQLYSIRQEMTKDPLGSLTQVKNMGWEYVEHANYVNRKFYGWDAREFRKVLDDLGLKMISGHTVMGRQHWDDTAKDFTDSWKYTVEDAAVLGQKYVISPSMDGAMRKTYDDFMRYMDIYNKCGVLCQKQGMKFGYHNHDFEFSERLNNIQLFDIMMKSIDPALVVIQIDIGNLYNGGAVAMDVVKQYPGRFENIHAKDAIQAKSGNAKFESCVVGEGVANVREVLEFAYKTGSGEVTIIEQEAYQGRAPMDCMKLNLEVMRKWGFA